MWTKPEEQCPHATESLQPVTLIIGLECQEDIGVP